MSIQLGSAYGKVVIDSSGVKTGVDNAIGSLGNFQKAAEKIGSTMQKIGGAMTLGLTLPITAFLASSVHSAMEAESALAEVEAVIKSTGGAAGVTVEQVKKLAAEFQKITKFSDEEVMSGESMLLTFTKIGSDVFPMATEAMLNMAEKFGSVENASIQLGKALNDPVGGVTALRRVGVMLSDQQEQQVKDFMAVNDIASAQKVILKELETEFGGLAVAAGNTTAGKFAQFKNTLDDFKETVGVAIIPTLIRFMNALTPILVALSNLPPGVTDSIVAFLGMVAVAGPLISFLGTLIKVLAMFGPGGTLAGVGTFFTTTLLPAFTTFFTFITTTAIPAIAAFAVANAWWIVPLLLVAGTIYLVYLAFKNNFMGIRTTFEQLTFLIGYQVSRWVDWFKGIGDALYQLYTAITTTGYAFTVIFEDGSGALLDLAVAFGIPKKAAQDFLIKVYDAFSKIMTTAKQLVAIFKWAFGGIGMAIDWVVSKIDKLKASLANFKLPDVLTPGSPTPFENGLRGIASAMDMVASKNMPNLQASLARPMQNNSSTQQQNITMQLASGLTVHQAQSMIQRNNELLLKQLGNALGGG